MRIGVAVIAGLAIPLDRFLVILRHAQPALVDRADIDLRGRTLLVGGEVKEPHRFLVVLHHAAAIFKEEREIDLGVHVPLVGSHFVPLGRFDIVGLHAERIVVHRPDIVLRLAIALLGQRLEQFEGQSVIALLIRREGVVIGRAVGGARHQQGCQSEDRG